MNIVNCYNKNNEYFIDFRQLLEEDEFSDYDEKLREKNITFTDIAKEPSSVNEIISRTVHNYVINPEDLKYIILDKTVILDPTSDSLIKLKNAIKEYAGHFKNMIIIEQGGDPVGELKREAGNGRNFYLFTESDRDKLIKEVLDKIIEIEENPDGLIKKRARVNMPKLKDREESREKLEKTSDNVSESFKETATEKDNNLSSQNSNTESDNDNFMEDMEHDKSEDNTETEPKKKKFKDKIIKGIKEKTGKKAPKKQVRDINEENEIKEEIKFPKAYAKPENTTVISSMETRINRQEEMTVKEMLRRQAGETVNNEVKNKTHEENKKAVDKIFTEERLLQAVKMKHILEKKKIWRSTNNVIIVRGLYGNICATYLSIVIANNLQNNNASVAYINDSHNDFLYTIQNYGLKKTGKFYMKNNIVFMEDFMAIPDVNFYIIDSKEAYYSKRDTLLENGFTPFYLVVANGDAKGISFLKNEEDMLKTNDIYNYRIIVKDLNTSMYDTLCKEFAMDKIIEYKHIDDEPFGVLAINSSIANELYGLLDEMDEARSIGEEEDILEEENEI